jgi:phosphosulfolactate phosphohydrolase-like enzyme
MLGAAGAYAAAIVAPSAAAEVIIGTGAGAALVAVMIIVAGASAVAAAVRSVVADVVIAASGMAELALDDFVPCEDFQRTRTENQQQTQQQTKDFLCLFLHSDPLLFGIDLQ